MLKLSVSAAVALVLLAGAPTYAQTTTDSKENYKPPEMDLEGSPMQSDYELGKRLLRHKHYAEAVPHLELALADKPQDADLLSDLGYAKLMLADYDSALYYDKRALAIDANNRAAHEHNGEADLAKNDLASAQAELATLTTLCTSGCDERNALATAIAAYKPSASPASAAAPAQGS